MWFSELGTPVSSSNGDDRELGENDGSSNSGSDFLCALDSESEMAVKVSNGDESLEAGTLTGTGLLLDGHDLHNFVLELGKQEVDDLVLLDGEREQIDLLNGFNISGANQATELCALMYVNDDLEMSCGQISCRLEAIQTGTNLGDRDPLRTYKRQYVS